MMFPINYKILDDYLYKKPAYSGKLWEIIEYPNENLLIVHESLFDKWTHDNLLVYCQYNTVSFDDTIYYVFKSDKEYYLLHINCHMHNVNISDIESLIISFHNTREKIKDISLTDSIFYEKYSIILPIYTEDNYIDDNILIGRWATKGVNISIQEVEKISHLSGNRIEDITNLLERNNIIIHKKGVSKEKKKFSLIGREFLEKFFYEYIIDIVENIDKYNKFGITFPTPIILYGPPGTGKTYAVEQLADYLNWPIYKIEAKTIASPYIHETSRKISELFDEASKTSPSILIIDEMDAFLSKRQYTNNNHTIEEISEFLKKIPDAINNKILIVGMTNRLDSIDDAILRHGRFDHIIEVGYASDIEIMNILQNSFKNIPIDKNIDMQVYAKKLANRPLSDIGFFIKESARIAVKNNLDHIDEQCIKDALEKILISSQKASNKQIGFF